MAENVLQTAIENFTKKIEEAIKGNNAADDITNAVWDMFKELNSGNPRP